MRARFPILVLLFLFANVAFGKDVYLSIGGQVGNFCTDARIFNPSFDKDIVITARYLQNNQNNTNVTSVNITVPKRSMAVYDNVISALFPGAGGIGAVRLTSDDDFVATQRIYAQIEANTLGQFVPGLDVTTALQKGVLIQLKQNTGGGGGTYRTNVGGANPNAVAANVTMKLYNKVNVLSATRVFRFEPFGVLTPSRIDSFFSSTADLSDAWISFDSDQPLFLYGSIIDNGSTDPTFITASADSGVAPPEPELKTVSIDASNFQFDVTGNSGLKAGDQVKLVLRGEEGPHGFSLVAPNGTEIVNVPSLSSTPVERTVTLTQSGTYFFFCTNSNCGIGHTSMTGQLDVAAP